MRNAIRSAAVALMASLLVLSTGLVGVGAVGSPTAVQDESTADGAEFDITDTSGLSERAVYDTPTELSFRVTNTGDEEATERVTLRIDQDRDGTPEVALLDETVTLAPGESRTFRASIPTRSEGTYLGTYDYVAEAGDDSVERTLEIVQGSAYRFEVSNLSAPGTATQGETVTASADVRLPTGGLAGATEQPVELRIDLNGDGTAEMVEQRVTRIEAGDPQRLSFDLSTDDIEPGTYTYGVFVGDSGETTELTVEARDDDTESDPDDGDTERPDAGEGDGAVYYQVDLVTGEPEAVLGETRSDFYSPQGRLLAYLHGTGEDAVTYTGQSSSVGTETAECVDAETIAVDGDTATVELAVGEDCERTLSLVSYEKPGEGFDRSVEQTLFDSQTETLGPGEHTLSVSLPGEGDQQDDSEQSDDSDQEDESQQSDDSDQEDESQQSDDSDQNDEQDDGNQQDGSDGDEGDSSSLPAVEITDIDAVGETVTLRNAGDEAVDLASLTVDFDDGQTQLLPDVTLDAGETVTVSTQADSDLPNVGYEGPVLNNENPDTVRLLLDGEVVDERTDQ